MTHSLPQTYVIDEHTANHFNCHGRYYILNMSLFASRGIGYRIPLLMGQEESFYPGQCKPRLDQKLTFTLVTYHGGFLHDWCVCQHGT